jgi:DNA processing protein
VTAPAPAERLARLRLARTDRVGPVTFRELLARYGSAAAALDALPHLAGRAGRPLTPCTAAEAEHELAAGERLGARLLVLGDPDFPPRLARIDPPSPVLWALGRAELLSTPAAVALVGARIASAGGQRIARGLALGLGEAGVVVVSGMARGIDAAAHEGGLPTGTVAVLGGGIDDIYPPEHADLYRRIAEVGCVLSESPVGARAQARDFPRRNRLIAGLSQAVVAVEAELRSGSLITARLAAEQGREVFAVPGSPLDPRSRGVNDLLRQGAHVCEGVEDILRELRPDREVGEHDQTFEGPPDNRSDEALRERVAALLSPTPTPRDELARALGAPVGAVSATLLELALAGRAELLPGGLVSLP